jgi:hypothetical protein
MATKQLVDQRRVDASILKLIEDRPAFQGAPELDAFLTRAQTAEGLVKAGFPVSPKTLATKASRGGGPPYSLFGPRPLYRWRDALVWAHRRMTPPRGSSSESDSAGEAANGQREDPYKLFATPHSKAEARDHHAQTEELALLSSGKVSAR